MNIRIALPLCVLAASGCNPMPLDGLYFFRVGSLVAANNSVTCEENFVNANCVVVDGGEAPDFTTTTSSELSEGGVFLEVLEGYHDDVYILLQNDFILTGVKTADDVIDVGWSGVTDMREDSQHVDGYTRSELTMQTADIGLALTRNPDDWSLQGDLVQDWTNTVEYVEQDVTSNEDLFSLFGWINGFGGLYLESLVEPEEGVLDGRVNQAEESDCADTDCRIRRSTSGRFTRAMKGYPLQGDGAQAGQYGNIGNTQGSEFVLPLLSASISF